GYVPFSHDPLENLKSMVLPSVTLSLYLGPPLVRFLRSTASGILGEDYVKTARAKGIRRRRIIYRHVAPNTLIPAVTYLGLQLVRYLLRRDPLACLLAVAFVLAAIFAPLVEPHALSATDLSAQLSGPSANHLLGTDQLGRDVFSRLLGASRVAAVAILIVVA